MSQSSLDRTGRQGEGEFQQRQEGGDGESHVAVLGEWHVQEPPGSSLPGRARRLM